MTQNLQWARPCAAFGIAIAVLPGTAAAESAWTLDGHPSDRASFYASVGLSANQSETFELVPMGHDVSVPSFTQNGVTYTALAGRVADKLIGLASLLMVADLYLHTGALARARDLLDEADALVEQQMLGNAGMLRVPLTAKRAWILLAEGDAVGALQRLRSLGDAARDEDRLLVAWVGAAAALALGDSPAAAGWLADIDIAADGTTDTLAPVLAQRLLVARAQHRDDGPARARATALLAAGRGRRSRPCACGPRSDRAQGRAVPSPPAGGQSRGGTALP